MKISYAVPVCNEHKELERLLEFLTTKKRNQDEIVVQYDEGNTTPEVFKVIGKFENQIRVCNFRLNNNFASFKNNLKNNCSGEWIFQIDADEVPSEYMMEVLPTLLEANPTTEVMWVPRINTVEGLTQQHIQQWRWRVNEKGWVNFPDYQCRIFQNSPSINWAGKVHEVILGHRSEGKLPMEEEWCLIHDKHIKRQEIQNQFYNTI
jgi:glycosyltransferase involved in cell wall biosynthesis